MLAWITLIGMAALAVGTPFLASRLADLIDRRG